MKEKKTNLIVEYLIKIFQGAFVGVGAMLPGISGGVLCVIFGVYNIIMEFFADPIKKFKSHLPKLLPYGIGVIIGLLLSVKGLKFFFERYENPSICVFVGLIIGMFPSLFKEAGKKGREKTSYIAVIIGSVFILSILSVIRIASFEFPINFATFLICGFFLALSIIAPGMSFSTFLMPLGLYQPFLDSFSPIKVDLILSAVIGAVFTVVLLSKAVNKLFEKQYTLAFHAIFGIVIGATIMTVPYESFESISSVIVNIVCIIAGIIAALILDKFNQKFADVKE